MAEAPALSVESVSKRYGGVQALEEVSLRVSPGEIVAVVGENGAGKSTLVGVAAGRVRPDAGVIRVGGRSFDRLMPAQAAEAGVRLVPQELLLCPEMSVVDNVMLGRQRPTRGRGGVLLDGQAARREAARRLERLRVAPIDLDRPAGTLTVVEQTFVQIARGLTPGAAVMLIDEPTAPMDDAQTDTFLTVLRALTEEGIAIVYISHRLDEIFQLAHRVAVLRDGRTVAELTGDDMNHAAVIKAMVGEQELRELTQSTATTGDTVLEVRDLSAPGLAGLSFELHEGEILTIYGINGSGREVVGPALIGAVGRRGEVRVNGRLLRPGSVTAAVAAGFGYVPAERRSQGLDLEASVASNLTVATLRTLGRFGFVTRGAIRRIARDWIERLRINTPSADTPIGDLSGGSQQKVLLARWLAAHSRVLVLEEPTRGVDVATKAEIYHLLRQLGEQGTSSLIITSDIEEASLVSHRVLVLRQGRLGAELTAPSQSDLAHVAQAAEVPGE